MDAAQTLAQAILNTIHEPFLVLDDALYVLAASRSFYQTFRSIPNTQGCRLQALGDGQWDIPPFAVFWRTSCLKSVALDGFEVEHDFPISAARTMLLNARKVLYDDSASSTILLAFSG